MTEKLTPAETFLKRFALEGTCPSCGYITTIFRTDGPSERVVSCQHCHQLFTLRRRPPREG